TEGDTASLRDGHTVVWTAFSASVALYALVGISKYVRLGYPTYVSTLACVLLLLLMLCWACSGLAFFFDRYRVPLLVPLAALPLITAWSPWSDHFYATIPVHASDERGAGYSAAPGMVMNRSDDPVIVVAANGGGIQAGAWAARVLTGLDETLRGEFG